MLFVLGSVCFILSACTENKAESPSFASGAIQQEQESDTEKETKQQSDAPVLESKAVEVSAENITESTLFQSTEPALKLYSIERIDPMYYLTLKNEGKEYALSAENESFPQIMFQEEAKVYSVGYHVGEQTDEISVEFWNAGGKKKIEFSVDDAACSLELPALNFREIDFGGEKLQSESQIYQLKSAQLYENAAVLTLENAIANFFHAGDDILLKSDANVYSAARIESLNDTKEVKILYLIEDQKDADWAQIGILCGDKLTPITGA